MKNETPNMNPHPKSIQVLLACLAFLISPIVSIAAIAACIAAQEINLVLLLMMLLVVNCLIRVRYPSIFSEGNPVVIRLKHIPFGSIVAITIGGLVFTSRKELSANTLQHEHIHIQQIVECGMLMFYLLYIFEWVFLSIKYRRNMYRFISFEQEAYMHATTENYIENRMPLNWLSNYCRN